MSGRMDSDAVAEVLAEQPPALDDITRARMEQSLLEAAREPRPVEAPRRSRAWIAGGALAAAAAVALGFFALRGDEDEAASSRVAEMELRSVGSSAQSGTIDEGSSLRTRIDEVAEIRIEDSVVHLEPSTEVRLAVLGSDRMVFELLRGEVRVEFHPRAPGEERMSVQTSRATVEVVGTVFTVRETEHETEVSVAEGEVRVVPREGEARAVAAGESTRLGEARAAADVEPVADEGAAGPAVRADLDAPPRAVDEARAPTQREARIVHTPAQLLARARGLSQGGDGARAVGLLRQVARSPEASARTRAQAFNLLGDLLAREGELSEAAEAYDAAVRQRAGPLSHMAIYDLARLQERRLNDPDAARASYRRYLAVAEGGPLTGPVRQALCRLGDTEACPGQAP